MPSKRAKIFMHGGSQAVRLPKEFRFDVGEVEIRKDGDAVILEPPRRRRRTPEEWAEFWAAIDAAEADAPFPDRDQPPAQERDWGR